MKTLVVDDDHIMRRMIMKAAMSLGHEVTGCPDAEKAMELYEKDHHPMIVLDWMLPGMSGIDFCRKLRSMPGGDDAFILMVTAKNKHEDLIAVLDAGANDYISKPVDMQGLITRLTVAERIIMKLCKPGSP